MNIGEDVTDKLNNGFRRHIIYKIGSHEIFNSIVDVSLDINLKIHESIQFKFTIVEYIYVYKKTNRRKVMNIGKQVNMSIWDSVRNPVRNSVGFSERNSVSNLITHSVRDSVYSSVWSSVWGQ